MLSKNCSVQATQLKCFNDEKLQPETKKKGRKGQNDNDYYIPETEPGAPVTMELLYIKGTQRK